MRARSWHAAVWQASTLCADRLDRQIRCVCASPAWLGAQQDPFVDCSSWCCVVASVARLIPGHPIARNLRSDWGMVPLHRLPILACDTTSADLEGRDLTDETLRSAQKPEKIDRKPGRYKNWSQIGQEILESRWETTEDNGLYANGKWVCQKLQVKCVSTKVYSFDSLPKGGTSWRPLDL